ncbi:MAG: LLM class flavin-dependent oxidoreductase, partial [Nocardioidaceae bacterium]
MDKRLHFGIFTSFTQGQWLGPNGTPDAAWDWPDGRYYIDIVRAFERACFDYVIFEDSLMVSDVYQGTAEVDLKHALHAPKQDPAALVALLAGYTEHIGLVPTLSTSFYPPYLLARLVSTLDSLSRGR